VHGPHPQFLKNLPAPMALPSLFQYPSVASTVHLFTTDVGQGPCSSPQRRFLPPCVPYHLLRTRRAPDLSPLPWSPHRLPVQEGNLPRSISTLQARTYSQFTCFKQQLWLIIGPIKSTSSQFGTGVTSTVHALCLTGIRHLTTSWYPTNSACCLESRPR